jgi:ADP-heptose:LPS heptosyltransferase
VKVLVVRTDRLGDLVLSLPVFEYIKTRRPAWEVHALVAPGSVPLVENNPHITAVWTWNDAGTPAEHADLERRLAAEGFTAVVLLQYRHALAALMHRAQIPRRLGPLSKMSSWFLLNRGSWQARSRGRRHELTQNLRLARRLIEGWPADWKRDARDHPEPQLYLTDGQREIGRRFLAVEAAGAGTVAFVHPGSGGSALDWEPARFAGVANALGRQPGWRVFVTGSAADTATVAAMKPHLSANVEILLDRYPLRDFLGIVAAGDLFVGPSTGPLHIAAALGTAAVGLYPPVVTMSPDRWGPRGPWSRAVTPDVKCPSRRTCFMERCIEYNCMDRIREQDVLARCLAVVNIRRKALDDHHPA